MKAEPYDFFLHLFRLSNKSDVINLPLLKIRFCSLIDSVPIWMATTMFACWPIEASTGEPLCPS